MKPVGRTLILIAIGAIGGILAIPAAFIGQVSNSGFWGFFVAPAIEEALKPAAAFYLAVKRPKSLLPEAENPSEPSELFRPLWIAACSGALIFSIVENIVYTQIYFPDHPAIFEIFRYAVCTPIHLLTTTIVTKGISVGLYRGLIRKPGYPLADLPGEASPVTMETLVDGGWPYFALGFGVHLVYNFIALGISSLFMHSQ